MTKRERWIDDCVQRMVRKYRERSGMRYALDLNKETDRFRIIAEELVEYAAAGNPALATKEKDKS